MSTIHDRNNKRHEVNADWSLNDNSASNDHLPVESEIPMPIDEQQDIQKPSITDVHSKNAQELSQYLNNANKALGMVDDIVMKQYLTKLSNLSIMPDDISEIGRDIVLFKINQMVYEKDEFITEKFISAISAMTYADCSIFLLADGYEDHTDFYLGVKGNDEKRTARSIAETFRSSINGQFPGIIIEDKSVIEKGERVSEKDKLLKRLEDASAISSCVGIPSFKDEDALYTNMNYVQGIEKLALAMQGRRYTAIILARNVTASSIEEIRLGYENLYTQLSAVSTQQLSYSTNESLANAISRAKGYSDAIANSHNITESNTDGTNKSTTNTETVSSKSGLAKAGSIIGGALAAIGGVALMCTGIGAPAGLAMVGVGSGIAAAGASGKQTSKGKSETKGEQHSKTTGESAGTTITHTDNFTQTDSKTATIGSGKNFTLTLHNKHIEELLKRIDQQLNRISMSESTGLWSAATYFFSYDNDSSTAETGAAIFKSIMQGEGSGVEASAVNTWYKVNQENNQIVMLSSYIADMKHPQFVYCNSVAPDTIPVENSSLVSSKELSMLLSLPRKSVPGLPVVEHASLAKEVVRHNAGDGKRPMHIGQIFDQGLIYNLNHVKLDSQSLTQHVFVTGSTGCGKSETVYKLIHEARLAGANFLIIEPAKGEYKKVFGNANVFGTNPKLTKLLRINPFKFPDGIHILEHIDRLIEIFNVCWPMYAAMPDVLKKAVIKSYENTGWDLYDSSNKYGKNLFPTFKDLLNELENVIKSSAYSEEVKGNYTGSLVTRVESLTNGLNGEIFGSLEISDNTLFDEDTIIDLSRVGSQETRSLIMGLLVMKLSEYRISQAKEPNSDLKHITVLEEAHNILKRTSKEQSMEGSNVAGKAVEMLTNSIAEMRTYGEGFIIVDQSPTSVDIAAIKNTNTKIIMRLPDGDDRRIAGKSAAMKDNQIDEIAKLPTGVGVVYQNNWVDPVLCKIKRIDDEKRILHSKTEFDEKPMSNIDIQETLKLLLKGRLAISVEPDIHKIYDSILNSQIATSLKIQLIQLIQEYKANGYLSYWEDHCFGLLSRIVTDILGLRQTVKQIVLAASSFEELDIKLINLIKENSQIPEYMNLVIRQSLMKDYGLESESKAKIYTQWYQTVKNELKAKPNGDIKS